ncbi:GlcG/HbpS family heme-binding protein [Rhodovulum sulfidophilum]|uniref:GlcG/HbpS family heme-binding protein n=1 Tax=Rhodovulum sulfidophilum TaxID=35806 RepID=UPI001F41177C|nr:heme-binding protein [Rhodovulum sulfidophilum]
MMNRDETQLIERLVTAALERRGVTPAPAAGLSLAEAEAIAARAQAASVAMGVPVVISVADATGDQILFHRMEGSLPASAALAPGKAWTAAAFRMGTDELGRLAQPGGMLFGVESTHDGRVVAFGGGLPVRRGGTVVGAVGISGGTVDEDMAIARQALNGISNE